MKSMPGWCLLTFAVSAWAVEEKAPEVTIPPCCATPSRASAAEVALFAEPAKWTLPDPGAWMWEGEGAERVLRLTRQSQMKPRVRSPFNLAWFEGREWKDFTLTAEVRLTKFDDGNNDLRIAFAREAEDRFYYAHLGEKADEPHHQIHLVDRADRRPVTVFRTTGTPWKPGVWHSVKVVRNSATGDIGVWFDGAEEPVLVAKDRTLGWGKIGLGSFDDLGEFRNVRVRGLSR